MAKLLLIDDDLTLLELLNGVLVGEGWVVETANNGRDGLQLMQNFSFDLVLLDWQLPDIDGLEVLSTYRSNGGTIPIIFLTGKKDVDDKESGLDAGADDYLTKPFDVRELLARMRSVQRRSLQNFQTNLSANGVELNLKLRTLHLKNDTESKSNGDVKLSTTEASILEFFFRHPDQLFSAAEVFDRVWPSETEAKADTLRVHLHVLRRKLSLAELPELVKTIKGSGYILETGNKAETNKP
ncbi:response regulator transcription factor [soil metagenome]